MEKQIRILIVDSLPRTRASLRALLSTCTENENIREAMNGLQAFQLVQALPPDVVLFDVRPRDFDELDAIRLIKRYAPQVKIIVLSMYSSISADAVIAGADAFVSQEEPPEKLLEALAEITAVEEEERSL